MMRVSLVFLLFAGAAMAQSAADLFNRAPADVDEALRERIKLFYQAHVDGKHRQAEQYVAEDTKDFYYNSNKPKYLSFEITRIEYSDNFTRAKATVACEQYVMMPGFAGKPIKIPVPSTWKIENGKWYWYVDQEALRVTPFGKMTPGPPAPPGAPALNLPNAAALNTIPRELSGPGAQLEKSEVVFKAGEESSAQVAVANLLPGVINLEVAGSVPGLEAKLDRTELKAGEKAVLTIRSKAVVPRAGAFTIVVAQTGRRLPIQVIVK